MITRYPPISVKCPHFLHGGDYNPEQWADTPEIWDEDLRLMKLARCNVMTIGVFSWSQLEPEENKFTFDWLDTIMDKLAQNGIYAALATPSGARPAWMSLKYPEVLRVTSEGRRQFHRERHNHCRTSPVYREKCRRINTKLAERYKDHPALLAWHISNEINGDECHCDLCLAAFRRWLREKYANDLGRLNRAWWTRFWSHEFSDWEQIRPVDPSVHGMMLDWKRFITDQAIDFFRNEIAPLRALTPDIPVTTNFMGVSSTLNYWKFAREVNVVSWDSYPPWHSPQGDTMTACQAAFTHDTNRCLKGGRPFMLMESTPSATNWAQVCKLKRPGAHLLTSLQAVAHGSDTVQYFQWRKSRGGAEKFHGAVVDHGGGENTRVFRDVARVGEVLAKLDAVIGTTVPAEVAIVHDWENRWALDLMQGLGLDLRRSNTVTCMAHYRPFWARGIPMDVIDQMCDFSRYKLLITPMAYMLREGFAGRVEQFVASGGVWVATYWTGIVDENDLCFPGGWPGGGLRDVLGIRDEETDATWPDEHNRVVFSAGNPLGLTGEYESRDIHALIHAESAEVLAAYGRDFYAGRPALTRKAYKQGWAYYMASRNSDAFLNDFYGRLARDLKLRQALPGDLPDGVSAQMRADGKREFVFIMNFNAEKQSVDTGNETFTDMISGGSIRGRINVGGYGTSVIVREPR
ncbi:MAG: beta-galactosidase [Kiritimatiellae bacterium]|nr:beta-galactosidase [Kiritimatiellia bacterium]